MASLHICVHSALTLSFVRTLHVMMQAGILAYAPDRGGYWALGTYPCFVLFVYPLLSAFRDISLRLHQRAIKEVDWHHNGPSSGGVRPNRRQVSRCFTRGPGSEISARHGSHRDRKAASDLANTGDRQNEDAATMVYDH